MRKLLALSVICLSSLAAHAQQVAASRLKPVAPPAPAHSSARFCLNCAKVNPVERDGAEAVATHASASRACLQQDGARPGWPLFSASSVVNSAEPVGRQRLALPVWWSGNLLQFFPTSNDALASQNSVDAFDSLFGRPNFNFSLTERAASGCAAFPFGMGAAALFQSGGTVNSGTAGNFAFYATTGTAVSENTRLKEVSGTTLTYEGTGGLDLTGSSASGQVQLSGATSGTVTLSVKDNAGSYTFKLPDSAGSSGQVLTTDGSGTTAWTTISSSSTGSALSFDTLTSGSSVTWTFTGAERRKANLTLSTNAALSLSGVASGSEGDLYVKQDATGGRTLTLPANSYVSGGGAGGVTLSSSPHAIDKLHFAYDGTNYYWDAPVANYSPAPTTPRGIIFNGSTQYAHLTLPNSSPWSSMGAFQIVYRVRTVTTGVSGRFFDAGGNIMNIESSGRIDFKDWRDSLDIFHTPTDLDDAIVKIQFDPSNSRWTEETWKADGSGHVSHTVSLVTTSNYDMHGVFAISASSIFAQKLAAHYDWFYIKSGVDALNVFPGAEPGSGSYLAKWTFDDVSNPNADSSGNGLNLTLVGSPTFENTP